MADEGLAVEEAPVEEAPVEEAQPAPIIDAEGNFKQGWMEYLDEDIRTDKSLSTITGLKTLARNFVNTKRMVGMNKVGVPNENSTEEDWKVFYKAAGCPDDPAAYSLSRPEEMPEEYYNPETEKEARELFHRIGLNDAQAKALYDFHNSLVLKGLEMSQKDAEQALMAAKADMTKEWGAAYEQKLHLANAAIDKGTLGDEDYRQRLTDKFGNDPDFIRYSSNLGSLFAEHSDVNISNIPTPTDIQEQINDLMGQPAYIERNHPNHKQILAKVQRLFEQKAKSEGRITK